MISVEKDYIGDMLLVVTDREALARMIARLLRYMTGPRRDEDVMAMLLHKSHVKRTLEDGTAVLVNNDDDECHETWPGPKRAWLIHKSSMAELMDLGHTKLEAVTPGFSVRLRRVRSTVVLTVLGGLAQETLTGAAPWPVGNVTKELFDACSYDVESEASAFARRDAELDAFMLAMIPSKNPNYGAALHQICLAVNRDDPTHADRALRSLDAAIELDREYGRHAFVVEYRGGDRSLFFARDAAHAVRIAMGELDIEEVETVGCEPMPNWDVYADAGDAPAEEWLRQGFSIACYCGHNVASVGCVDGCPRAHGPLIVNGVVYCSEKCHADDEADIEASAKENVDAEEAACVVLLARHPTAEVTSVRAIREPFAGRRWMGQASFRFRGQRGTDAIWREDGRVTVGVIDAAAWRAFSGLQESPHFPRRCPHGNDVWACNVLCPQCEHACMRHGTSGTGSCSAGDCSCGRNTRTA